jgi:lipopolysaccharide export system permease protein
MNACGIGYTDFYRPVLLVLMPFMAVSIYTSLWLNPQAMRAAQEVIDREADLHEFYQMKPGQFNDGGGGLVFFMESITDDRLELRDVIISKTGEGSMYIETGETGRQQIDDVSGNLFLVIGPGDRYEGEPGDNRVEHTSFDQHGVLIEKKVTQSRLEPRSEQMTLKELRKSTRLQPHIELRWRVSVPVTMLVLALLAVPLANIAPRQGR